LTNPAGRAPLSMSICYRIKACGLGLLLATAVVAAQAYDAVERYETRQIEGWTLRMNRQLLEQKPLAEDTLRLLECQLREIARAVPTNVLARLREVPIWIELAHPRHPCMCYHPSADWLREHDMNPEKARSVEIANAKTFLKWTRDQPWMVLHELAHAYHHRVLKHDQPEIKAAFERAKASGSYDEVLHIDGKKQRHYALSNDQEYFAEGTEAYFGTNDFYPFVRAELKQHDPELFALLAKLWGVEKPSKP
jgi:hypothetical protein